MKIQEFQIERYFAQYEFSAKYMLSSSDCDGYKVSDILQFASDAERTQWEQMQLGYTETRGSLALRRAIAAQYATMAVDNILVASPGELNFVLMNVLLEAGDEVICMAPMYQSLYEVAGSLGSKLVWWEPENQVDWRYDPERLAGLVTAKTKLIVVNFPHNPTGYLPRAGDWARIVDIARRRGIYLFSDEMYRGLLRSEGEQIPAACDVYDKAISLWGMAKTFGMAGLRIGWLASRDTEVLRKVEAFKDYLSICNSAPSDFLATIALQHADHFTAINNKKIARNTEIFTAFAARHADRVGFVPPVAGSTAFVRLNASEGTLAYAERLVAEAGIMLLPSEMFGYGPGFCRIGFGRENMPEVLQVWEEWMRTSH